MAIKSFILDGLDRHQKPLALSIHSGYHQKYISRQPDDKTKHRFWF